jgi:CubicO group peptidase (beta-lactamase class C family)
MRSAPLEAWQSGPHNRWAYLHVPEVVPTVTVPRGDGPALELPQRPGGLEEVVERVDGTYVDGVAVARGGALVLEHYDNGMGPSSRHLSQSVGKSAVGLLAGVLAGRGVLDPAAPVTEHVPEVAGSGYEGATVQHLLDMTAAIDFVEDYGGDFWKYDIACGWHPPRAGAGAASILEYLPTIGPATWRHGEVFHYASPNTDLLGIVLERSGDAPLAELLGRELWGPLGAGDDADMAVDPAGTAVASGGLCATLRDYLRVGLLVLAGGAGPGGRQVVPSDWVAQLGQGDPEVFGRSASHSVAGWTTAYRNQWWGGGERVFARGIHGQLIAVDREHDVVMAVLSSWPDATDATAEAAQQAALAAVTAGPASTDA